MGCLVSKLRAPGPAGQRETAAADAANQELLDTIRFLRCNPMFSAALLQQEYPIVAAAFERRSYRGGQEIVRVGEAGDEFLVVRRGTASVWIPPPVGHASRSRSAMPSEAASSVSSPRRFRSKQAFAAEAVTPPQLIMPATAGLMRVATLRSGDYLGERAVLAGEAWDMTVVAESQRLECIALPQEKFRELGLHQKLHLPKRVSLSVQAQEAPPEAQPAAAKSQEEAALIRSALESSEALVSVLGVEESLLKALVSSARRQEAACGEVVVSPEESVERCLYIVQEGCLAVRHLDSEGMGAVSEKLALSLPAQRVASLALEVEAEDITELGPAGAAVTSGGCFGELALLYEAPYTATVKAVSKSVLWAIGQAELRRAIRLAEEERVDRYDALLAAVELFAPLLSDERRLVASALAEVELDQGCRICEEGSVGRAFYILLQGEVTVEQQGREPEQVEANEELPEHFGQEALARPAPMVSGRTVTVASESARFLSLTEQGMDSPKAHRAGRASMGLASTDPTGSMASNVFSGSASTRSIKSLFEDMQVPRLEVDAPVPPRRLSRCQIERADLTTLAVLGRGAFGFVELCSHRGSTEELYALKTMSRAKLAKSKILRAQVLNEKHILEMTSSAFVVKLFRTFRSDTELCLLLEPALGGELYKVYWQQRLFGKEQHGCYYTASVVCALEHLHERFIIYRDLKPENLLLDSHGRLKLTDMGLAKFVVGKTYTVCGTAIYLAPEAASQQGYTSAVDWWALGILSWELLTGKPPFPANSRGEAVHWLLSRRVLADIGQPGYDWPQAIPHGAREIIRALVAFDPGQRVPVQPGGTRLLRATGWFQSIDWPALEAGRLPAPYLPPAPDLATPGGLANFANNIRKPCFDEPVVDDGSDWDADF